MSITLYREGLPRIELNADHIGGREGMLVGFVHDGDHVGAIVMAEDGSLTRASLSDFRLQFHYDPETDQWTDENERGPDME